MTRLQIILILTLTYFTTILVEILLNSSIQSSSTGKTFLGNIQSSLLFTTLFNSFFRRLTLSIVFLLLGLLILYRRGIYEIFMILFKYFELIPVLIDLINIIFIYQYTINDFNKTNSFIYHNISLIFAFIRFLISFDFVCQKCDRQWKKQTLTIFDLLLYILVNITLIRYSDRNLIRIGRKIILGVLIVQFSGLTDNKTVWIDLLKWNNYMKQNPNLVIPRRSHSFNSNMLKAIHLIIYMRWILPLLIVCLFLIFTFQSIIIKKDQSLFVFSYIYIFLKTRIFHVLVSMTILIIVHCDKLYNQEALRNHGSSRFCLGLNPVSGKSPKGVPFDSKTNPTVTTAAINNTRSLILNTTIQSVPSSKISGIYNGLANQNKTPTTKPVSQTIGQGIIEVEKGDITKQTVDVIIGSSSSENLKQVLLKAGGQQVQLTYTRECKNNPNSLVISTPQGNLSCQEILFLKWKPDNDQQILRQSLIDLVGNVIQHVRLRSYTSIAFPALGCGGHACSVDIVVKTMVREMKKQIQNRKLPWTVKFIIHPDQQNVYDEFCKQLLSSNHPSIVYDMPSIWEHSNDNTFLVIVPINTNEYKSIISKFDVTMKGNYKEIVKLERIQNKRWYMQYIAHSNDFRQRLNEDTEKRLYHGCPEDAAKLIIKDCFNRSFAGVNDTLYGVGVYFSSNATYSHRYTRLNSKGERCMFVARVLVGKSTLGDKSMKTRPLGFDSTTGGKHITVTYHDAQAYAEYLITYK